VIGDRCWRRAVALVLVTLGADAARAPAQGGRPEGRIVTVAVPLPVARGPYRIEVKPGVRLVGPAAGEATDSVLPLSFVLPATAPAGLQALADVVVAGRRLAVGTRVAERRALSLRAASSGLIRVENGDTVWLIVENRGNVPESVGLRPGAPQRGYRVEVGRSPTSLAPGARAEVPVVVREVGSGEASLRVTAAAGPTTAYAQLRIAAADDRRTGVPLSVTLLAPHERGRSPVVVASGQAWLGDSIVLRASYATRDAFWNWFPGLVGSRQRLLELRAPRWSFAAGDLTLPGSAGVLPWLSGTGARASLGGRFGWSGHGALLRETHASTTSAEFTAAWRAGGLGVRATALARIADDRSLSRLWVLGGDWARGGARWSGEAGSANVGAGEVPVGALSMAYAGGRVTVRGSAAREAELTGTTGLVRERGDFGAEVRVSDRVTYFGRGAATRSSWPAGDARGEGSAVSTDAVAGARVRFGAGLVTTSVRRTVFDSSRFPSLSYGATEAAAASVVSLGRRTTIRPEVSLRRGDSAGRWSPRAGASFAWSAADAFVSVAGEWGQPRYGASDEPPRWNASAQMWGRRGRGSGDLAVTFARNPRGQVLGFGTASLAWRVRPRAELLGAIRKLPGTAGTPGEGWSVSFGLRTGFSLAWNAARPRGLVFEDLNRNGVRDAGDHPIAGVPLRWGRVEQVSDAHGRFQVPDSRGGLFAWPESDPGWRVVSATGNRVAVARTGGVVAVVRFGVVPSDAVESIPSGAVVLRGMDGTEYIADVDSLGQALWTGLPAGTYTAWHQAPDGRSGRDPASVSVTILPGATAGVQLVASYSPRRMQVHVFGEEDAGRGQSCPVRRVLVPGLTFDAVRCLFPGEVPLEASRGAWVRWTFVGGNPSGRRYGDFLFFRDGALVVALVRRLDARYSGPASLGPFTDG
jgi:hypothetical protein